MERCVGTVNKQSFLLIEVARGVSAGGANGSPIDGATDTPNRCGDGQYRRGRLDSFYYACLIAGHYQAGMIGTVLVK